MVMEPPWSGRIEDRALICLMCVTRGEAWLVHDSGTEPVVPRPGDIAIVRGPEAYTVTDAPGRTPHALIGPGGTCHTRRGEPLAQSMKLGERGLQAGTGHQPAGTPHGETGVGDRGTALGAFGCRPE